MPPDPKKEIEAMLEASAKARREKFGRDPAMPNPMRARLHEEIAQIGQTEHIRAPRGAWLQMFWPRLAVAGALATLLVVAPVMWWRKSHPDSAVAMQAGGRGTGAINEFKETASPPAGEVLSKGPAVAEAQPNVSLDDNSRTKLEPQQTPAIAANDSFDQTRAGAEATPATQPAVTKTFLSRTETKTTGQEVAAAGQNQPAAAAPASEANHKTADARLASAPSSARAARPAAAQQFAQSGISQAFRNNAQTNRSANILSNFRVQQDGSEIRIVDADGSTYTGKVEPFAETDKALAAKRKDDAQSQVERQSVAGSEQTRFRASGFNVSLKKPLVFEGDYVPSSAPAVQFRAESRKDTQLQQQEAARIVGRATVHGETPVEVDAVSVEPSDAGQKAR